MITHIIQAIVFTAAVTSAEDTSLAKRISQRSFPSVFQAWDDANPLCRYGYFDDASPA